MIHKKYSADKKSCKVTFTLPANVDTKSVCLCGDFNNWDMESTHMEKDKNENFRATVDLAAGQDYKFRYCIDSTKWENDPDADAQVPNPFGSEDSIVKV